MALLVGGALRLWGLPDVPPGPHYDEAANGILAAEIANGVKRPIFIPSYTGKEVLFFYSAAVTMRVLGATLLALRLTSALIGLLTVAATAWLAYELFAEDTPPWVARLMAMLTAALIATSFWHVLLSRLGFRAIMQPLLQALTLATLWRGLRQSAESGAWTSRGWLLLSGGLCGLTGYTYLAARAFPLPLALAFLVLFLHDVGQRRQRLEQVGLFVLTALICFAPLGLYFIRHPAAFTTRMDQVGPGNEWHATRDGIIAASKMLFLQGDPYVRFNLPSRPLFGPLLALLGALGLGDTIWQLFRASARPLTRAREILLLVWLPVMLLPTALAVNEITPSNLRAIGLLPLIFILPARGTWRVAGRLQCLARTRSRLARHLPLYLTVLLLLGAGLTTARAYWGAYTMRTDLYQTSDGDLADIAAYLNQYDDKETTLYVSSIHYRHPTVAFLAEDYARIKWLVGASTLVYPAEGAALYLFPRSATPKTDWLARFLPGAMPLNAPIAPDGAPAFNGYQMVAPPPQPTLTSLVPETVDANFNSIVRLISYHVERAVSGQTATLTLVWQVLDLPPQADLTPFYHLTDPWGTRWGQSEPFHYAAQDWTPGETIVERVQIPIAPGTPPGEYVVQTGLYSQNTGFRLSVIDPIGRYAGTTVALPLNITRAEVPPDPLRLAMRQRLDLAIAPGLTLLGFNLDTAKIRPGERVHLTLFWQTSQPVPAYHVDLSLHALSEQATALPEISLYSGAPVHGTYPSNCWTAGQVIVDHYNPRWPLSAATASAGDYTLSLRLLGSDGEATRPAVPLGSLTLVATDRRFTPPPISHTPAERVTLGERIEFLGYDLDASAPRPGGTLDLINLTLYWRALDEIETHFTVFTHLLGPEGRVVAQQDNPPVNGTYPTTLWLSGEVITDPYQLSLPPDLSPGEYPIEIGFYVAATGLRLGEPIVLDTVVSILP